MGRRLHAAVVGTAYAATQHVDALRALADAEIVAVVASSEERARQDASSGHLLVERYRPLGHRPLPSDEPSEAARSGYQEEDTMTKSVDM